MFGKKKNIKKKKTFKKSKIELSDIPSSSMKREYYKKRREQKRVKNAIFKTHFMVKCLLIIFLLFCSSRIAICHFWYLPQNAFQKYPSKYLKIIGNRITPEDKILKTIKTIPIEKKPIYLINTSSYEKEIEKLSPVKRAFVRRYWLPARFEVTIEEEIPVLTVSPTPNAPEIAALTRDGRVISKNYLPLPEKANKTYKILTYDDYTKWSKDEIIFLKTLSQRIEDFSGEKLLYLDIRNKRDVYAQLESIKVRIGEFNTTLKDRIERLNSIMPQIENLKRQTDYVDIRWDNTTYLKKKSKKPAVSLVKKDAKENNNKKPESKQQPKQIQNKTTSKQTVKTNNVQVKEPAPQPLSLKTVEP
ncbi:MAG: FtsQ-type POTRA domain-containing protein [Candidatus Gastranaerophilales bacterium]|nr:FtsQ-type POTRA domain-containing protein [Candidatus Gastranaerophilales bacterium]